MTRNNLSDWLSWLETLHPNAIDLGLDRISKVANAMKLLPLPHVVFTVGGTNGKGSCVAILENVLLESGYTVGAYTSPHLLRFNERIRLNGKDVTDELLLDAFARVEKSRQGISLTYFEFTTLAAFVIFRQMSLEVVVLEVGLGGRLDAVNIVDADAAIITTIDYDHCDWLGNTIEQIALEKAGIFRDRQLAVYGDYPVPATITQQANKLNVSLFSLKKEYDCSNNDGNWSLYLESGELNYQNLPMPKVELKNAAAALIALDALKHRLNITKSAINTALQKVELPARFQLLSGKVTIILDVAHNPQAARLLAEKLRPYVNKKRQIFAVFSMLEDKDIKNSLLPLAELISTWYVAKLSGTRAASLSYLQQMCNEAGIIHTQLFASVESAFDAVWHHAKEDDVVVVFGSFYTVASVMNIVNKGEHTC